MLVSVLLAVCFMCVLFETLRTMFGLSGGGGGKQSVFMQNSWDFITYHLQRCFSLFLSVFSECFYAKFVGFYHL